MDKLKKLLPHALVVVALLAVALAYMYPVLQNKELIQSDIVNFLGMSKEIVDFREATGEEPVGPRAADAPRPRWEPARFRGP